MMWLNLLVAWFSWVIADRCEPWGLGWCLNVFASALNGAVFFHNLVNLMGW